MERALQKRESGFTVRFLMSENRKAAVGYRASEVIFEERRSVQRETQELWGPVSVLRSMASIVAVLKQHEAF